MNPPDDTNPPGKGQFLVYSTEDGQTKIEVRLENETVWLTQQHMAALFQTTKQNVSLHLQNIFKERELTEDSVVKESSTTASDGKTYPTKFYNLDAIISVGYRVKSAVATRFRICVSEILEAGTRGQHPGPFPNPNGIESLSPGLRGTSYPGWTIIENTTPTGLRQTNHALGCNPFRVEDVCFTVSQGSSSLATLGWMTESLWDSQMDAPQARDLEQTIAGNVAEILEA